MRMREIKEIIEEERQLYIPERYLFMKLTHQKRYLIWKTLASFRLMQYWKSEILNRNCKFLKRLYAKLAYRHYFRQRNIYSEKSGVEISNLSVLGRRLNIWHGSVVISGHMGDDCVIHGNNVIGNKGNGDTTVPKLGNRIDLGVGAVVIGGVQIADDCIIGANAVVNKDCEKPGSMLVGIPAYAKG